MGHVRFIAAVVVARASLRFPESPTIHASISSLRLMDAFPATRMHISATLPYRVWKRQRLRQLSQD